MENQEKTKLGLSKQKKNILNIKLEEVASLSNKKISKMQKIKKILNKKNLLIALFTILVIGLVYFIVQYQKLSKTPAESAKEKTALVLKQISNLAVIPNDPNAVLATVSNKEKLKDQHFFDFAENGDYVVIFPSAMRAVLYRPSINKIINIGPLSTAPAQTGESNTTQSLSVKNIATKATSTKAVVKKTP